MYFERDEFEEKLVQQLLKELDDENINVTENLIQRTLSAVKESEHFQDIEQQEIAVNKGENKRKKKTLLWVRRVSTLAAACLIFILGVKSLENVKKSDSSSPMKNSMAESIEESAEITMDTAGTDDNTSLNKVEIENKFGIAAAGEEGSINQKVESSIMTDSNEEGHIDIYDIVSKEQSEETDSNTTYIILNFNVEEENEQIVSLEELIAGLSLEENAPVEGISWAYKIYMQTSTEYATVYYISETNIMKIKTLDLNGLVSEYDYKMNNMDNIISEVERICYNQ